MNDHPAFQLNIPNQEVFMGYQTGSKVPPKIQQRARSYTFSQDNQFNNTIQSVDSRAAAKHYEIISKYKEYINRAAEQYLQSLKDLARRDDVDSSSRDFSSTSRSIKPKAKEDDVVMQSVVDGFFKEASKYSAGLLGVSRFFKLLKAGKKLEEKSNKVDETERDGNRKISIADQLD